MSENEIYTGKICGKTMSRGNYIVHIKNPRKHVILLDSANMDYQSGITVECEVTSKRAGVLLSANYSVKGFVSERNHPDRNSEIISEENKTIDLILHDYRSNDILVVGTFSDVKSISGERTVMDNGSILGRRYVRLQDSKYKNEKAEHATLAKDFHVSAEKVIRIAEEGTSTPSIIRRVYATSSDPDKQKLEEIIKQYLPLAGSTINK